jgi:hypothetical protein
VDGLLSLFAVPCRTRGGLEQKQKIRSKQGKSNETNWCNLTIHRSFLFVRMTADWRIVDHPWPSRRPPKCAVKECTAVYDTKSGSWNGRTSEAEVSWYNPTHSSVQAKTDDFFRVQPRYLIPQLKTGSTVKIKHRTERHEKRYVKNVSHLTDYLSPTRERERERARNWSKREHRKWFVFKNGNRKWLE